MPITTRSFSPRGLLAVVAAWVVLIVILANVSTPTDACDPGSAAPCPPAGGSSSAAAVTPGASGSPASVAPTGATPSSTPLPTPSPTPAVYTFRDEFGGSRLKARWGRHWPGFGNTRWSTAQLAVGDGVLTITARRDGSRYVSGLIDTVGSFEQRYGTFEARIRFDPGTGLWPAFWLAQPQNRAREVAEIDVMEVCANDPGDHDGNDVTLLHSYVHRIDGSHAFAIGHRMADLSGDWHVYAVEWAPDRLIFTVDGVEFARFADPAEIPDMKMAVVLDLAVGGRFCGDPDATTPDEATMEVDWIRVTE